AQLGGRDGDRPRLARAPSPVQARQGPGQRRRVPLGSQLCGHLAGCTLSTLHRLKIRMSDFSVCVYCGSRLGASPAYEHIAREVGTLIGRQGWRLVYGGGRAGLMGCVADAVLAAGGTAVGVTP